LPLTPGSKYVYEAKAEDDQEHVEIEVLSGIKGVMGISAITIRDTVYLDVEVIKDTFDWFAQDKDVNIWYFGGRCK